MKTINTSQNGWKKLMDASMKKGERFLLLTPNQRIAEDLERGKSHAEVLKAILFGSGAAGAGGAGVGAAVGGLTGAAKIALVSTLLSHDGLEPVLKGSRSSRHHGSGGRLLLPLQAG